MVDHYQVLGIPRSASAAEIMAASLKEYKKAIIIGQKTFGKGSVQSIIPVHNFALKLTTSYYYSPFGAKIDKIGVMPDYKVVDDDKTKNDEVLDFVLDLVAKN